VKWQERFSSPEHKRQYVRSLFATIADRYDLITVLLSGGLDKRWKRRLVSKIPSPIDAAVLDLACGTGDIAFHLATAGSRVVGLDITPRMVRLASLKPQHYRNRVRFVTGDMMALPMPDASFDVVTTGYGLRNVPDLTGALREIHRVLRPGGQLLSLDFDKPPNRVVRAVYLGYLTVVGSTLGAVLHGDPDTYRYIPESIQRYPGAAGVSALARQAGFVTCTHEPVLGGFLALHFATK
jgi:demethylmenaquinone methyltransferase/2-methoxy-6-polyprenyl-1,4-benzoquinol methylase